MAKVSHYIVPLEAYPRYKHAVRIVTKYNKRCQKLFDVCGFVSKDIPEFDSVCIFVHSAPDQNVTDAISVEDLMFKNSENTQYLGSFSANEHVKGSKELPKGMPVVDVVSHSTDGNTMDNVTGRFVISVAKEDFKGQKDSKDKHHDVTIRISNKTDIATDLNNLLERFVFRTMNERVSVLKALDATSESADNVELDTKYIPGKLVELFRNVLLTYQKLTTNLNAYIISSKIEMASASTIKQEGLSSKNVANYLAMELKGMAINGKYLFMHAPVMHQTRKVMIFSIPCNLTLLISIL